jgi:hypothetical protein
MFGASLLCVCLRWVGYWCLPWWCFVHSSAYSRWIFFSGFCFCCILRGFPLFLSHLARVVVSYPRRRLLKDNLSCVDQQSWQKETRNTTTCTKWCSSATRVLVRVSLCLFSGFSLSLFSVLRGVCVCVCGFFSLVPACVCPHPFPSLPSLAFVTLFLFVALCFSSLSFSLFLFSLFLFFFLSLSLSFCVGCFWCVCCWYLCVCVCLFLFCLDWFFFTSFSVHLRLCRQE